MTTDLTQRLLDRFGPAGLHRPALAVLALGEVQPVNTQSTAHRIQYAAAAATDTGQRRRGLGKLHRLRRAQVAHRLAEQDAGQHLVLRQSLW